MTEAPEAKPIDETPKFEWAIVEIFGHRRHAGRTIEEERFGAKMLRIDVPVKGNPEQFGWQTFYYGGASIFSFVLTDEQSVMTVNKPYEPPSRQYLEDRTASRKDFEYPDDNEYED
ncbi:hypothetical protein [Afipia carboxidovorans]|uniref:hypothetical protein n=1 Tax=Afipia carboxidovorans TaxID=40137 RepID=UPI0030906682|nr:hypothetical protein CRBSH125_08920 [Afipia carboxidovorans]